MLDLERHSAQALLDDADDGVDLGLGHGCGGSNDHVGNLMGLAVEVYIGQGNLLQVLGTAVAHTQQQEFVQRAAGLVAHELEHEGPLSLVRDFGVEHRALEFVDSGVAETERFQQLIDVLRLIIIIN